MIQAIHKLERSIRERRETDIVLINYWLYYFLIKGLTLGIYSIILYFKRIGRVNNFIERKQRYYNALIDFIDKKAKEDLKYDLLRNNIIDLSDDVREAFSKDLKKINATLSFFLTIITLGIWGLVVRYKLNKIWNSLQNFEQDFNDKLSSIWINLNIVKYPIEFKIIRGKKRSFMLYGFLSIITAGIWWIVWNYKIHTDPDNMYPEYHSVEDAVIYYARSCVA